MIDLTARQREDLTEQFAELVVDQMDLKSLMIFTQEHLIDYYNNCSLEELKEEVNNYDEELFDELVDNVSIENDNERRQHLEEIKYDREVN
tara:strand:+ start:189 stop:461 length:273 start_codon:yes stop_codon:yes gene_type:complete